MHDPAAECREMFTPKKLNVQDMVWCSHQNILAPQSALPPPSIAFLRAGRLCPVQKATHMDRRIHACSFSHYIVRRFTCLGASTRSFFQVADTHSRVRTYRDVSAVLGWGARGSSQVWLLCTELLGARVCVAGPHFPPLSARSQ